MSTFFPKISCLHLKAWYWFWADCHRGEHLDISQIATQMCLHYITAQYGSQYSIILSIRCSGTIFSASRLLEVIGIFEKNKATFGDRNTIYLCLEVVACIKFNYFPCGFKSRAASVKFNYFPLRFTWQRCHCYLPSASGQSESLGLICSIIPMLSLIILLSASIQEHIFVDILFMKSVFSIFEIIQLVACY